MALKVYAGLTSGVKIQVRTIVAATSQKQAAALVGVKLHYFREYWSETFNDVERQKACSKPGTVFKASTVDGFDFTETKS